MILGRLCFSLFAFSLCVTRRLAMLLIILCKPYFFPVLSLATMFLSVLSSSMLPFLSQSVIFLVLFMPIFCSFPRMTFLLYISTIFFLSFSTICSALSCPFPSCVLCWLCRPYFSSPALSLKQPLLLRVLSWLRCLFDILRTAACSEHCFVLKQFL